MIIYEICAIVKLLSKLFLNTKKVLSSLLFYKRFKIYFIKELAGLSGENTLDNYLLAII